MPIVGFGIKRDNDLDNETHTADNTIVTNVNRTHPLRRNSWPAGPAFVTTTERGFCGIRSMAQATLIDLTGHSFCRLLVLEYAGKSKWKVRCDCGKVKFVHSRDLRSGAVKSCGCWRNEITAAVAMKHGHARGHKPSTEYVVWLNMIARCYNTDSTYYRNYGGRGITVCERWRESFAAFYADIGPRPTPAHTIDRKDNDGNYESSNVRWATRIEQARNQRSNHIIVFRGESRCLAEWAEILGVKRELLQDRLRRGWSVAEALTATKFDPGGKAIAS